MVRTSMIDCENDIEDIAFPIKYKLANSTKTIGRDYFIGLQFFVGKCLKQDYIHKKGYR